MLQLIPVQLNDAPLLYRWRLDEDSMRNSLTQHIFSGESHVGWLCEQIAKGAPMWLGKNYGDPIGAIYFSPHVRMPNGKDDVSTHEPNFIVSLMISPTHRNMGHGSDLLQMGLRNIKRRNCYATILKTNLASQRVFEKNNFTMIEDNPMSWSYKWTA